MFRGKTMVPCGALLLAGAAALILLHPVAPAPDKMPDGDRSSSGADGHRPMAHGQTNQSALQAAVARLNASRDEEMSAVLEMLGSTWQKEALADAVSQLFSTGPVDPSTDGLRSKLLSRWVKDSPLEASAWAESLQREPERQAALTQVALAWSGSDRTSAWNWACALPNDDPARQVVMASLVSEFTRDDPALALDCSSSIEAAPERVRLIEHAIANLAATNPTAALEWANGLGDESERTRALGSLTTSWADTDPRAAATLAVEAMPPGPDQERTVIGIVQRWAQINVDEARAWVADFPDGSLKANALGQVDGLRDSKDGAVEQP